MSTFATSLPLQTLVPSCALNNSIQMDLGPSLPLIYQRERVVYKIEIFVTVYFAIRDIDFHRIVMQYLNVYIFTFGI